MANTGYYRVRRGWFGKSVLQELYNTPSLIGGQVDASIRSFTWFDVPYDSAPRAFISQWGETHDYAKRAMKANQSTVQEGE